MARGKSKRDGSDEKSLVQSKEKVINFKTKKETLRKEAEIFDGVDSLIFLKDAKEGKKDNDIDQRITLLKSELKSLMSESSECITQNKDDLLHKIQKRSENSQGLGESVLSKKFKPCFTSTPFKPPDLLDPIVTKTNYQYQTRTGKLYNPEPKTVGSNSNRLQSSKRVEELLYKTFVVQNFGVHLSDLELDEKNNSKRQINQEKSNKCKKTCRKSDAEKPIKKNNKHCKASSKRGRKKRIISLHNSQSEIEVINLDSALGDNEIHKADSSCVVLDVSDYDWNEPFDVDADTNGNCGFHSDVQIINHPEAKDGSNGDGVKSEHKESNESSTQLKQKKVWECPVCLEQSKGQEIVATQCGHVFCKICIENHTSRLSKTCPTCRADLTDKPFITLFNF